MVAVGNSSTADGNTKNNYSPLSITLDEAYRPIISGDFFGTVSVRSVNRRYQLSIDAQKCTAGEDLPNFGCVNTKLFRGAQPTEEGIKELARRGVKTIINLRDADEKARAEENEARKSGIKFINAPLDNLPKNVRIAPYYDQSIPVRDTDNLCSLPKIVVFKGYEIG